MSKELSLNESGLPASAWVNLSCVTGKRITLPLNWEKQAVALVPFRESGELHRLSASGDDCIFPSVRYRCAWFKACVLIL